MSKLWSLIWFLGIYLRPVLDRVMQNQAIQHFSKLGGLTGMEVGFQIMMQSFLMFCGAGAATCTIFEYTAHGLYLIGCFFLVVEALSHFMWRAKLDFQDRFPANAQRGKD